MRKNSCNSLFKTVVLTVVIIVSITPLYAQNESIITSDGVKLTVAKCLEYAAEKEQYGDKKEATRFLNMVGSHYWESKEYSSAILHFEKSLRLNQEISNINGMAMINNNLGMIHADAQTYEKSLFYFEETLKIRKTSNEKLGSISALINIAVVLNNLKRYKEAAQKLEEALVLAREINDLTQIRGCYGMLSETYEKGGNHELSIRYFNLYRTVHEMLQKEKENKYLKNIDDERLKVLLAESEKQKKEIELLMTNKELDEKQSELAKSTNDSKLLTQRFSKQELAIQVLTKDQAISNLNYLKEKEKVEAEKKLRYYTVFGLMILVAFAVFLLISFAQKRKANIELNKKNKEVNIQREEIREQNNHLEYTFNEIKKKNEHITSSINYARMIQAASLPSSEKVTQLFENSFIFFKPRDIVSGDFYWVGEKNNKKIIVAADCTGHGVPGAFMSMIGINLLNQIVSSIEPEPDKILAELHKGILEALNKKETNNRDGMDISILVIDEEENKISFSGAKNPLVYIQNKEIKVIKGDKESIGSNRQEAIVFTKHEIELVNQTYLYIFSDGFQDQFGGEGRERKFSSKKLQELLFENFEKSFINQEKQLNDTLIEWMKASKQIDDILVIGIKLCAN